MKYVLLFFLQVVITANAFAQSKEANDLYSEGKYKEALLAYSETFSNYPLDSVDPTSFYKAAEDACKLNELDSAIKYLGFYAEMCKVPQLTIMRLNVNFKKLHSFIQWPEFEKLLQQKDDSIAQLNHYNLALRHQLDEMWYDDQHYRYLVTFDSSIIEDSKKVDSLWTLADISDSINIMRLKKLLDQYGWLTKKQVGDVSFVQWMIIQHSDKSIIDKYLPLLKKQAEKGEVKKADVALTIDRANIYAGKKQIYGSQITYADKDKGRPAYIAPLEDPDNVDARRAKMDLEPIAKYAKSKGIYWDLEAYKRNLPQFENWDFKNM
ncbi:DUF6624 domain-containing protein [Rhizosphaericola mali]|uniref:Tetratricopeptide repeat protein n=1 Tax=Rhizosphaericola mali TaxID=2545455 RepID=A0A5P2G1M7_9BACT|nr:DUF6624 domain-containing protein [Rhizosphaericola mali]QES89706.1 hypothetical protein E0W69_013890 [Rhizosphaericola mali]